MDFLTLDKIFVLDNFSFVQDKKYFVWADGQGKRLEVSENINCIGIRNSKLLFDSKRRKCNNKKEMIKKFAVR